MSNQKSIQLRLEVIIDGQEKHGILTVTTLNGNILLNFYQREPTDKKNRISRGTLPNYYGELSSYISYNVLLGDNKFSVLFDDFNNSGFTIVFSTQQDLSDFIRFIKQRVQVTSSPSKKYLYLMNPIDFGPSNAHSTFIMCKTSKHSDVNNILNYISNLNLENKDDENPLPTQKEFTSLYDAFPSYESENKIEYLKLRSWKTFFSNSSLFENQTAFFEVAKKVDSHLSKFTELNAKHIETIRNVILTYSNYNYDGSKFLIENVRFLFPIFDAYVSEYGDEYDNDQCEESIFKALCRIYNYGLFSEYDSAQRQKSISLTFITLCEEINKNVPDLISFLYEKGVVSFDFLINDCWSWFINLFDVKDLKKIWFQIPKYKNENEFLICFITAMLLKLCPELEKISPLNEELFLKYFENIKGVLKDDVDMLMTLSWKLKKKWFKEENKEEK